MNAIRQFLRHNFPTQFLIILSFFAEKYIITENGYTTGTPAPTDDSWKEKFEADLKENYGVTVDHYEFVGGTSYQVYVEINDEMVPYVCVDSATGNYHG